MLDWTMDWYVVWNGLPSLQQHPTRLCYLFIASSALYQPAFMQPPRSCRGQRSHSQLHVVNSVTSNKCLFYTKILQSVSCVSVQQFETLSGKLPIIHVKRGKFLEFKTSEIASASLSGTIEHPMVRWSPGLPDLLHCPCVIHVDTAELLQPCQHSLHQPLKCGRGITLLACPMGIILNSQSPLCVINTVSLLDSESIGICQQSFNASKVEIFFLLS